MSSLVETHRVAGVLVARMNDVPSRNALSLELKDALLHAVATYAEDPSLRCLVLTGSEHIFCAGGDLRIMADELNPLAIRRRMAQGQNIVRALTTCEKPVLCAVNGAAVGAGLALALLGDLVVASDSAYLMPGYPSVGVMPDLGLLYQLPKAVGMPLAKDLLFTNRKLSAQDALACGLVSRVFPSATFEADVMALAGSVAERPTVSLGFTKLLLDTAWREDLNAFLGREALAEAAVFNSQDFLEGTRAFLEKRPARFKGG